MIQAQKILPTSRKLLLKNQRENENLQIEHTLLLINYPLMYKEKTYVRGGGPENCQNCFKNVLKYSYNSDTSVPFTVVRP
jgi:hypothetical protein